MGGMGAVVADAISPVAALTSDGLTAAALISIKSSLAARDRVRISTTGASAAAFSAFANRRTQRASTATGRPPCFSVIRYSRSP
jgi:hypothetical protein